MRWTALMFAVHNGHAETVKTLIDRGADVNNKGGVEHPLALAKNNTEISQLLENAGAVK